MRFYTCKSNWFHRMYCHPDLYSRSTCSSFDKQCPNCQRAFLCSSSPNFQRHKTDTSSRSRSKYPSKSAVGRSQASSAAASKEYRPLCRDCRRFEALAGMEAASTLLADLSLWGFTNAQSWIDINTSVYLSNLKCTSDKSVIQPFLFWIFLLLFILSPSISKSISHVKSRQNFSYNHLYLKTLEIQESTCIFKIIKINSLNHR